MGILVDLAEWRRKKDEEAHQKEIEEIRALRAEVAAYLDELGGVQTGPYVSEEERDSCCLLYTSPSPRDVEESRMPSSA